MEEEPCGVNHERKISSFWAAMREYVTFPNGRPSVQIDPHCVDNLLQWKVAVQNDQSIGRVLERDCFSEDGPYSFIRERFQILAKYYLIMGDEVAYAQTVANSIITEWEEPIYSSERAKPEKTRSRNPEKREEEEEMFRDQAPLYIPRLTSEEKSVRRGHRNYSIRILALEASTIGPKKTVVRAEAMTRVEMVNRGDDEEALSSRPSEAMEGEGDDQTEDSQSPGRIPPLRLRLVELEQEGKGVRGDSAQANGCNNGKRKNAEETTSLTNGIKKGKGKKSTDEANPSPKAEQEDYFRNSFEYLADKKGSPILVSNVGQSTGFPIDRFISRKPKKINESLLDNRNVAFHFRNVAIRLHGKPQNRTAEFALFSSVVIGIHNPFHAYKPFSFSVVLSSPPLILPQGDYNFGVDRVSDLPVQSLSFQSASNFSDHWKKVFPFMWKMQREHYERCWPLRYSPLGDQNNFLYWSEVKEFLANFVKASVNVTVRRLTDTEMRTVQGMIQCIRLSKCNEAKREEGEKGWVLHKKDREVQREVEAHLFGEALPDPLEEERRVFLSRINNRIHSSSFVDDEVIYQHEMEDLCMTLTSHGPRHLSFNIFTWLHKITEVLSGSQLHTSESRKTFRMFNDHMITLHSPLTNRLILQKAFLFPDHQVTNDSIAMIRFDIRDLATIAFDFYDSLSLPIHFQQPLTHRHGCYFFGSCSAEGISSTTYRGTPPEMKSSEGVLNKNGATGLFAYFLSGDMDKYTKILQINEVIEGGMIKRKGIIVPLFREGDHMRVPPVYDCIPKKQGESLEDYEVNPIRGPIYDNSKASMPYVDQLTIAPTEVAGLNPCRPPVAALQEKMQKMSFPSGSRSLGRKKARGPVPSQSPSLPSLSTLSPISETSSPSPEQLATSLNRLLEGYSGGYYNDSEMTMDPSGAVYYDLRPAPIAPLLPPVNHLLHSSDIPSTSSSYFPFTGS